MELPSNMLSLTDDPTAPAISNSEIASLARLVESSPEEFQRAAARLFKRLAVEGFREIRPPRNYKELSTVIDLWRKLDGMDKQDKGGMPVGLVGVIRSVNRRTVVEVVAGEGDPGFD